MSNRFPASVGRIVVFGHPFRVQPVSIGLVAAVYVCPLGRWPEQLFPLGDVPDGVTCYSSRM